MASLRAVALLFFVGTLAYADDGEPPVVVSSAESQTLRQEADRLWQEGRRALTASATEQALIYADSANEVAAKAGYAECSLNAHLLAGQVYEQLGDRLEALTRYHSAVLEYDANCSLSAGREAFFRAARLSFNMKEYTLALEFFERALSMSRQMADNMAESEVHFYLGRIYMEERKYEVALKHLEDALNLMPGREAGVRSAAINSEIGACHYQIGEYDQAMLHLQMAERLNNGKTDTLLVGVYERLGQVHESQRNYRNAIVYYEQARKTAEAIGHRSAFIRSLHGKARLFLANGDLAQAESILQDAYERAEKGDFQAIMADICETRARIFREKGDSQAALQLLDRAFEIRRNLSIASQPQQQREYRRSYELYNQYMEKKIDRLENRNRLQDERQSTLFYLQVALWSGGALLLALGAVIYSDYRLKRKVDRVMAQKNQEIIYQNRRLDESNHQLEESRKDLIRINSTKDKFLSIISHDLKAPLNSLTALLDVLIKFGDKLPKSELQTFATNVEKSVQNLSQLLSNLLRWSESQKGNVAFSPRTFLIDELAETSLKTLKQSAQNKEITLAKAIEPKLSAYADPDMIDFVMRNLVSNSVKFTGKGGVVRLEGHDEGGWAALRVSDTGVGMSEEALEKLFRLDAFHSTKGTEKEEGTGLGLILCYEFVHKCGGRIEVESEEGSGTTFTVFLPKRPSSVEEGQGTEASRQQFAAAN